MESHNLRISKHTDFKSFQINSLVTCLRQLTSSLGLQCVKAFTVQSRLFPQDHLQRPVQPRQLHDHLPIEGNKIWALDDDMAAVGFTRIVKFVK